MHDSRIADGFSFVVLPPQRSRCGVAVVTLCWADWSADRVNQYRGRQRPTHDIHGFWTRNSLSSAFTMGITHALRTRTFVLQIQWLEMYLQPISYMYVPTCSRARKRCSSTHRSTRGAKAAYGLRHNSNIQPCPRWEEGCLSCPVSKGQR